MWSTFVALWILLNYQKILKFWKMYFFRNIYPHHTRFYLNKDPANDTRRCICKVFSHWLGHWTAMNWIRGFKPTWMKLNSMITLCWDVSHLQYFVGLSNWFAWPSLACFFNDTMTWKHFPLRHYWPFVRGVHFWLWVSPTAIPYSEQDVKFHNN